MRACTMRQWWSHASKTIYWLWNRNWHTTMNNANYYKFSVIALLEFIDSSQQLFPVFRLTKIRKFSRQCYLEILINVSANAGANLIKRNKMKFSN